MLAARNLSIGYPGRILYRGLDLAVAPGECWGILGPNGAGKTTLLHALAGLVRPLEGEVHLDGRPLSAYSGHHLARQIGVLTQDDVSVYGGTVRDYVSMGRYPYRRQGKASDPDGDTLVAQALDRLDLGGVSHRSPATLSGGERQRARIAQLRVQAPAYYCADEPLAHLDLGHQAGVMRLLRELAAAGAGVVAVLHDTGWAARYCDQVLLLYDDGSMQSGLASELLTKHNLERLYRCAMRPLNADADRYFVPE